jgi:hypothetical protein
MNHILSACCGRKRKAMPINCLRLALAVFLVMIILGFTGMQKTAAQTADNSRFIKQSGLVYERIVVQSGDTLWDLAVKNNHGNPDGAIKETMRFNKLKSAYLQVGQVIYVPAKM